MGRRHNEANAIGRRDFLLLPGAAFLAGAPFGRAQAANGKNGETSAKYSSKEERTKLPVTSWRTYEGGFHNGPTVHFDRLDPEDYMAKVRAADTEVVVVQTKSAWGYAYYDTKVGTKHPNLDYDLIARWVEAGHRNGLSVVAYYSGQLDLQAALKHPQWVGRNADGSVDHWPRPWLGCCHHSPFREYLLGMYREIFTVYDFDGLFIDGSPVPRWAAEPICYCAWCQERYQREMGEPLLEEAETLAAYRKRLDWYQESSDKFLDEVYQLVRSLKPGLPIWVNGASPFFMPAQSIRRMSCLYTEPIASPTGLSVGSVALRGWRMPGPQVGIFWEGYSRAPIETDQFRTAAIMMQNTRPRFITDEQNMPDGRQRPEFSEWAGRLQAEVKKIEVLLNNLEPVTSLGVVFSESTQTYLTAAATRRPGASFLGGLFKDSITDSIVGSVETLTKSLYPVEVLPAWRLNPEALSGFDMVVLPETTALAEAEAKALRDYVNQGGILLATWKPGLVDEGGAERSNFPLSEVLGVDFVEEDTRYAGKDGPGIYFQSSGHSLSAIFGTSEVAIQGKSAGPSGTYCPFIRVKGTAQSIFDYKLPYLVPDEDKHIFQTWDPAPPGNERIPQAATINRFGKGQAIYIGVPLFRCYQIDWIQEWIRFLVTRLVPRPPIRAEGCRFVHTAFYRQGPKRLMVQMVNSTVWTNHGLAAPLRDLEIVGQQNRFAIGAARQVWPKQERLTFSTGPEWRVHVPEVSIYSIVQIELT